MVKRGLLFVIATFVTFTQSFASEVTFQVDMSNQTVSPTGVHISGSVACGQGCTDPTACNYDPSATVDGPCTYPNFIPTIIVDQPSLASPFK